MKDSRKQKPKPFKNPKLEALSQATRESEELFLETLIAERGKIYGEPKSSHANIGLAWTGLIQQHYGITLDHPLPAFLIAAMMVNFKMSRAARVFHKDNYDDAKVYTGFASDFQQEANGH